MRISIIGTGNVASHLALAFEAKGLSIESIYGRSGKAVQFLLDRLYVAELKEDLDFKSTKEDIVFLCVTDNAIEEVASKMILSPETLLVHTSGATPIEALGHYHENVGVFYPLQSISKSKKVIWEQVPFVINANTPASLAQLDSLARLLSNHVYNYTDMQRQYIHLAAVFGSNFSNHLLKIVKDICESEKMDFQMFKSLVMNTVFKAFEMGPELSQTGPAIRNDTKTLQRHLQLLEGSMGLEHIYTQLSQHIIDTYSDE